MRLQLLCVLIAAALLGCDDQSPEKMIQTAVPVATTAPFSSNFLARPVATPSSVATAAVVSDFSAAKWLKPEAVPGTMGRDPVGAFRLICQMSWVKQVDPLVQPGVKKSMHLHFGWGNDALDENSTYETLRAKGSSNCQGGPLYRSAGWAPALLDGDQVVVPDFVSTYYKRLPASNPDCKRFAPEGCVEFPAGLRFVVGAEFSTGAAPYKNVQFMCVGVTGGLRTWAEAAERCGPGRQIRCRSSPRTAGMGSEWIPPIINLTSRIRDVIQTTA